MFLVMYARIVDNKKKGLNFEGPFYGPECETMQKAHEECRKLVTPSKDHILIKICDLDEADYYEAKQIASLQFNRTFDQMESSQSSCDAPRRKKFKR
jgi:hypothetical protein